MAVPDALSWEEGERRGGGGGVCGWCEGVKEEVGVEEVE